MRRTTTGRRYDSLDEFYEDPERWMSSERDLGLHWVDGDGATYRAAWIARTEELYCVRYRTPNGEGGEVEVLGSVPAARLAHALRGWSDMCGEPESFEWLYTLAREQSDRSGRARPRRQLVNPSLRAVH
jgi:hypothetical protein